MSLFRTLNHGKKLGQRLIRFLWHKIHSTFIGGIKSKAFETLLLFRIACLHNPLYLLHDDD